MTLVRSTRVEEGVLLSDKIKVGAEIEVRIVLIQSGGDVVKFRQWVPAIIVEHPGPFFIAADGNGLLEALDETTRGLYWRFHGEADRHEEIFDYLDQDTPMMRR